MKLNLSKSDGVEDKFNGFKLDNLKKTFFLRVFYFWLFHKGIMSLGRHFRGKKNPAQDFYCSSVSFEICYWVIRYIHWKGKQYKRMETLKCIMVFLFGLWGDIRKRAYFAKCGFNCNLSKKKELGFSLLHLNYCFANCKLFICCTFHISLFCSADMQAKNFPKQVYSSSYKMYVPDQD